MDKNYILNRKAENGKIAESYHLYGLGSIFFWICYFIKSRGQTGALMRSVIAFIGLQREKESDQHEDREK